LPHGIDVGNCNGLLSRIAMNACGMRRLSVLLRKPTRVWETTTESGEIRIDAMRTGDCDQAQNSL